jgi:hypothetical protein
MKLEQQFSFRTRLRSKGSVPPAKRGKKRGYPARITIHYSDGYSLIGFR